jgi:hypothetical protein
VSVPTLVTYAHFFSYCVDSLSGETFPGLPFRVSLPEEGDTAVDLIAHLDAGAELSIFDGARIASTLGIDLMAGREIRLGSVGGFALTARIHRLELSHPELGRFTLDAAISTVPIRRNLLGRDFFQHLQIGFREFHETFLIANDR